MNILIRINEADSVAVALRPLTKGENIPVAGAGFDIQALEDIPMGHKIALHDIHKGEPVIKYGFPIGEALADIPKGHHIHTHNLRTLLSGAHEYEYHPTHPVLEPASPRTFNGYVRYDGKVGVRNELWIIPTVGCVNDIALTLEHEAKSLTGGSVENVRAFTHPSIRNTPAKSSPTS